MWNLYDRLIEEIPENIYISEVSVGLNWTSVVSSEGTIGLAMTTDVQTIPHSVSDFTGYSLREAAEYVKSWNFIEAGIGMAAINAFYNSEKRMAELSSRQPDKRFCTFDIPIEGKKVVMVGHLRHTPGIFDSAASLDILERLPKSGDIPDSACEYLIPGSDLVLITGSAFVNKTMPRLLELAKDARVIVTGPSTPMAPALFDFGVQRIAGLVITEKENMLRFASSGIGGPPYGYGERFFLDEGAVY